ncbi:MAG: nucleoside triphosphate pyrophosphohydrolase [Xanthomonadales bacterium]
MNRVPANENGDSVIAQKNTIRDLLEIMARLRDPETGCPWDVEQDFSTIAPYTIEEAYEVADAIEQGDLDGLKDELGDLLFQVVFHARMAEEREAFDFGDVVTAVCEKMRRRHPHVFAREARHAGLDAEGQRAAWERHKDRERAGDAASSLLDHVPRGLAELQRSVKLQKRAAKVGFDWGAPEPVLDKLAEETEELHEAMASGDRARTEDELGDLLFVLTNLARQLDIDPARALRGANAKFERRFRAVERAAGSRAALDAMPLDDMEALWQRAKREEAKDS